MLKHMNRALTDGCDYHIVLQKHTELLLELVELNLSCSSNSRVLALATPRSWVRLSGKTRTDKNVKICTLKCNVSRFG